jgi:hypothetical protein
MRRRRLRFGPAPNGIWAVCVFDFIFAMCGGVLHCYVWGDMKPQAARMMQVQIPTLRAVACGFSVLAESPFRKNLWPMS